jgi:2-ketocyclohexanecarboxyl-CoA hydrolase
LRDVCFTSEGGHHQYGSQIWALKLYYDTEESKEGVRAFNEKRKSDFRRYTK